MTDIIVIGIVAGILGAAVAYIVKEKKKGVKCIGCPDGCSCSGKREGASPCGCGCQSEE